ncbi:hypothetical protein HAX54_006053 [Datura stramonium]|uniref:Uncharacterized protein n=1 Tax=Datura stramonium TaxID=4076 RepID=A0ABS8RUY9_DATST|nr:hypothetical protein [Datura stramonium]
MFNKRVDQEKTRYSDTTFKYPSWGTNPWRFLLEGAKGFAFLASGYIKKLVFLGCNHQLITIVEYPFLVEA